MTRISGALGIATLALAALTACGGGGGGDNNSTSTTTGGAGGTSNTDATAEGVYAGTLTGSTSPNFELLVLGDGSYWALYGTQSSGVFYFNGFIQGHGTSVNSAFKSSDGRDYGYSPAVAGTVNSSFDATKGTIVGTFTTASGGVAFDGGPLVGWNYVYNTPALLSAVTGAWTLTDNTGSTDSIQAAADGTFTATDSTGCAFSGRLTPRANKNVFDVAITFGMAPCSLPGQQASGIALVTPVGGGQSQLMVAVADASRQYGVLAVGTR